MPVTIDPKTERELRWYLNEEYKGDLGFKSSMGSITDTLIRGVSLGSTGVNHGVSQRALNAATLLKKVQAKLKNLTPAQLSVLSLAFKSGRSRLTDSLYGSYPRVALATPAARTQYLHDQPGQSLERLEIWLAVQAHLTRAAKVQKARLDAARIVAIIRQEAEEMLIDACQRYGANIRTRETKTTLSIAELAKRLHMDTRTVLKELSRRSISVCRDRGRNSGVQVAQLVECWSESSGLFV